jgi:hypothetical protein
LGIGGKAAGVSVEHSFGASGHVVLVEQRHQSTASWGDVVETQSE